MSRKALYKSNELLLLFWFGAVPFHIAIFARDPEFVNKRTCGKIIQSLEKTVWGRGNTVKTKKREVKVNNHGHPAGCTRCAHIGLFYTITNICSKFGASEAFDTLIL